MPQVNLLHENGKAYIEIIVEPSTVPISLRGSYYGRSGSTKQELQGNALTDFLFKKSGMTWDRVIEEKVTMDDIPLCQGSCRLRASILWGKMDCLSG